MKKIFFRVSFNQKKARNIQILRLICLFAFFLVSSFNVSANSLKEKTVSVNFKNAPLKTVIAQIEKQTDYLFVFDEQTVDMKRVVSVSSKDASVEDVLRKVLNGTDIIFIIEGNNIVLKNETSTLKVSTNQKTRKITGIVTDNKGETIIGASVLVKGTKLGTITNYDGNFTLDVTDQSTLIVSYIGYLTMNFNVGTQKNVTIKLQEDVKTLDEVVVVGYGTQKKQSVTGSLQTVKSDKLKNITTPSVENMLNGKVSGVYVSPGSGQPGSVGTIVIRGKSTINGSTDPLWVIDGVIVGSDAGSLNPNDVESITVLKDAASTAIYGSQGANGVILVTTKRSKTEQLVIEASVKYGATTLNNGNFNVMNGSELYDYYKSFSNAEQIDFPRWNAGLRDSNYNWWDLANQTGTAQDYNISISGGNEKQRSYFSIGVYDETGAIKGYDFTRYNFRYKVDYKPLKFLTVKPQLSGSYRKIEDKQYSVSSMYSNLPWDSPFDAQGKIVEHRSPLWVNSNSTNYLYDLQWDKSNSKSYEFLASLDFDINITDWLTFSSINNYKYSGYAGSTYGDPRSSGTSGVNGRINEEQTNMARRYTNQLLRFNKIFGDHSVSALVGYEYNDYWYKKIKAIGTGFVPGFEVLDVTAKPEKVGGGISEWAVQSYLSNVNYDYKSKYLAQISLRRDGASNFGDEAKYGNFFSISGGWNIHNEEFFKVDWINQLKLRASYGSVGNRPKSLYPQYDLYSVSQNYNGIPGALIYQKGSQKISWEKSYTTGLGLDATLFNRFRLTMDVYDKNTSDLLYPVPVSGVTGVTSIWANVGKVNNQGVELTLGVDIIKTKDLLWSIDANIGLNRNKVDELYGTRKEMIVGDGSGIAGAANKLLKPGLDADSWYIREWAGVDPTSGSPLWYKTVKDAAGVESRVTTSKYAEANEVVCGAYTPDFYGGFTTNLRWKNCDLSAIFGYSVGGKIYNYSRSEYDSDGAYSDRNQMKLYGDWTRWEKAGDVATHPVASYNNSSNSNKASSRYLEDGDYLKLRSLTLGYNISLPKLYISSLRVFISGENLFCITNYSGIDPEITPTDGVISGTTSPGVYPSTRKFVLGFNVTL